MRINRIEHSATGGDIMFYLHAKGVDEEGLADP